MTTLPAYIGTRQGRSLSQDAISGLGGAQPPHISIAKQRFTLVDAAGNERMLDTLYLDVVVVDINKAVSKIYYEGVFDPTAQDYKPPVCFSDNGIGASAQAIMPQSVNCQICPHNAWGSDTSRVTGKATKACNDAKKVAVIIPGDEEIVYLLRIPPATLKVWKTYVQSVCSHPLPGSQPPRKMELFDFVTRITFDKDTQGVLNFAPCPDPWYDEQDSQFIDKIFAENKTDALVGRTDVVVTADRVQLNAALPRAGEQPQAQRMAPPAPAQQPVQQIAAPAAETAPRRRGRPAGSKNVTTAAAPAPVAPQAASAQPEPLDEIPPFLQRAPAAPHTPTPAPAPRQQFGMEQPQAAPSSLDDAIAKAFALPT